MPFDIKIDSAKFKEIEADVISKAKDILAGAALKQEIGEFAVERLKYQARTGAPFNVDKSLPLLKESTIRNRMYLAKYNTTQATFEDGLSNLTITGQLLDSLTWEDIGDTLLSLKFVGVHPAYNGRNGPIKSKLVDNAKLVEYLAAKGFKVFDSSLATNKQFISRIKTICLRYIRRGLRIQNRLDESED